MVIDSLGWPVVANVDHSGVNLLWELLCKEALKCTEFRSAQPWIFSFEAQAGLWSMRGSDSPVLYCLCCQSHYINFLTSFKNLWVEVDSKGFRRHPGLKAVCWSDESKRKSTSPTLLMLPRYFFTETCPGVMNTPKLMFSYRQLNRCPMLKLYKQSRGSILNWEAQSPQYN